MGTAVVLLILAAVVALVVLSIRKDRKAGKNSCAEYLQVIKKEEPHGETRAAFSYILSRTSFSSRMSSFVVDQEVANLTAVWVSSGFSQNSIPMSLESFL